LEADGLINILSENMNLLTLFFCSMLLIISINSSYGFGTFGSQHSQLKRSVIADVGQAQEVPPPAGAKWENQVYLLNDKCFTMFGYFGFWGYGGKPAMLVVDEQNLVKVAIFETSIGTINVKVNPVQMVKCPEHANIIPSCDGIENEKCMEMLKQYQEKLQKQLERLQ